MWTEINSTELRVDHIGHADDGEARSPGPTFRTGAGVSRRLADARRGSRSCSHAEQQDDLGVTLPRILQYHRIAAVARDSRSSRDWAADETTTRARSSRRRWPTWSSSTGCPSRTTVALTAQTGSGAADPAACSRVFLNDHTRPPQGAYVTMAPNRSINADGTEGCEAPAVIGSDLFDSRAATSERLGALPGPGARPDDRHRER